MKSSYELAMERLAKSAPTQKLTDEQKNQITEIDSLFRSKRAERETFLQSLIAKAQAKGELQEVQELKTQLARDLQTIQEDWEARKNKVWQAS